jgi:hypothetical protein
MDAMARAAESFRHKDHVRDHHITAMPQTHRLKFAVGSSFLTAFNAI